MAVSISMLCWITVKYWLFYSFISIRMERKIFHAMKLEVKQACVIEAGSVQPSRVPQCFMACPFCHWKALCVWLHNFTSFTPKAVKKILLLLLVCFTAPLGSCEECQSRCVLWADKAIVTATPAANFQLLWQQEMMATLWITIFLMNHRLQVFLTVLNSCDMLLCITACCATH